jgi:hypothetical protein
MISTAPSVNRAAPSGRSTAASRSRIPPSGSFTAPSGRTVDPSGTRTSAPSGIDASNDASTVMSASLPPPQAESKTPKAGAIRKAKATAKRRFAVFMILTQI